MGYNNTPNVIVQIDNKAIREQQEKADRQTQVINQGTSLITADQTTPLDIQVEGRTLVPLQNSNLESNGTYVLANADKKTKVTVDNKVAAAGVGKFTKNSTLTRKTDYAEKLAGSNFQSPHNVYTRNGGTFPTAPFQIGTTVLEQTQTSIDKIKTLNGSSLNNVTSANGSIVQHIFSFDIISEIERNMGIIPGATKAQKIQWCKDNAQNLSFKWYGFGTGPNGPRAWHAVYHSVNNTWTMGWNNHTAPVVQIMTTNVLDFANRIDADGLIHMAAYADASDGVTASQINTDFIEFILDLKATAQLDTRPQISRVANFEGKVQGSTAEVPHTAWRTGTNPNGITALLKPTDPKNSGSAWYSEMSAIDKIDGSISNSSTNVNGGIAQHLFSFDLISEVERNLGRIPAATVPGKVQWLKDNLSRILVNWWGMGSSAGGNKATLSHWRASGAAGTWDFDKISHTSGTVARLQIIETNNVDPNWAIHVRNNIDDGGFVHFAVNSEPSDGVTSSSINTDFVELEITLSPGAVLHDPQVPLYQVDSAEYTKILGEWPEAEVLTRYPKTTGIQHVQNPYIMAEGENLLPPFYEWSTHPTAVIPDLYTYNVNQVDTMNYRATYFANVTGGQPYYFTGEGLYMFQWFDANLNIIVSQGTPVSGSQSSNAKLIPPLGATKVKIHTYSPTTGDTTHKNPMLVMGEVAKPFTPRNPSYLFAQVKLGQIGSAKDVLYKQDGWKVRKNIEKDVIMDGTLAWSYYANRTSFKTFKLPKFNPDMIKYPSILTGHEGQRIPANETSNIDLEVYRQQSVDSYFYMNADNAKTGMGATYVPVDDEVKAYFNGWQAKTVDGTGKPTSWRSLGDGVDAPTQTLAYVKANRAPNFTPYKISYVLDIPVTEDVSDKVEGDISVAGITQVEVGSGIIVREKATPVLNSGAYHINAAAIPTSLLKNKVLKILSVYKNGILDNKPKTLTSTISNGLQRVEIVQADYDATAEYKVTYMVLDRDKLTVNPYNLKTTYAKNIRSALEDTVKKVEDNTKDISINVQAVAELYKRIKSMGG